MNNFAPGEDMTGDDKSKGKSQGGGGQRPQRDQVRQDRKDEARHIGDRAKDYVSTTSTGPRNPAAGKKSK